MRVATRVITHSSKSDVFTFANIFDIHSGEANHNEPLFKRAIAKIAQQDDKTFCIGGGDYCGLIKPGDPRFTAMCISVPEKMKRGAARADGSQAELTPQQYIERIHQFQAESFVQKIEPIADRFIIWGYGNHELSALKHSGIDAVEIIAKNTYKGRWGGEYPEMMGGYMTLLRLTFKRETANSHATREINIGIYHGAGGGSKKGGKINRAVDMFGTFTDCDIIVLGHVHDPMATICSTVRQRDKINASTKQNRVAMVTSSFMETYTDDYISYGEIAGYQAVPMGFTAFSICPWYSDEAPEIRPILSTSGIPLD